MKIEDKDYPRQRDRNLLTGGEVGMGLLPDLNVENV